MRVTACQRERPTFEPTSKPIRGKKVQPSALGSRPLIRLRHTNNPSHRTVWKVCSPILLRKEMLTPSHHPAASLGRDPSCIETSTVLNFRSGSMRVRSERGGFCIARVCSHFSTPLDTQAREGESCTPCRKKKKHPFYGAQRTAGCGVRGFPFVT